MGVTFDDTEKKFVFDFEHEGAEDIVSLTGNGYPDLTNFIKKAIDNLHKKINLYNYDLVVMPESSSRVNQYMLRYIYRFAQPTLYTMTLVKALPSNISFDMKAYEKQYLDDVLENGMPRYSPAAKEQAKSSINADEVRELCSIIRQQNVLMIDDVTTSGSTLNEVLRTLRLLNEDNDITIFSLIGRKDLMAESM